MTVSYEKCRVCGSKVNYLDTAETRDDVIRIEDAPFNLRYRDIDYYVCGECGHIQCEMTLGSGYYDDYALSLRTPNAYYGSISDTQKARVKELARLSANHDSFLEIACGDGKMLDEAALYFTKTIGIEPSAVEAEIGRSLKRNIHQSYFGEETLNAGVVIENSIDAIYANMVFEHLEEPLEITQAIYRCLKRGGVGMIIVPDGRKTFCESNFTILLTEHINHYTPFSLSTLIKNAGLELVELRAVPDTIELAATFVKPTISAGVSARFSTLKEQLSAEVEGAKCAVIWGAGGKTSQYVKLFKDIRLIKHIVDSDCGKWGKYCANAPIPVEKPTSEILRESDTVIVFATTYAEEIVKECEEFGFHGKIALLSGCDMQTLNV